MPENRQHKVKNVEIQSVTSFFGCKAWVFLPFQNNPKNLDPSHNIDLDFWDCFRMGKPHLIPGPGCSKLTTSLVNEMLKFQMLISQICQYFLLKNCEKLLQCKSFSHFITKKYQCICL